jgi:hypothetical protein
MSVVILMILIVVVMVPITITIIQLPEFAQDVRFKLARVESGADHRALGICEVRRLIHALLV